MNATQCRDERREWSGFYASFVKVAIFSGEFGKSIIFRYAGWWRNTTSGGHSKLCIKALL